MRCSDLIRSGWTGWPAGGASRIAGRQGQLTAQHPPTTTCTFCSPSSSGDALRLTRVVLPFALTTLQESLNQERTSYSNACSIRWQHGKLAVREDHDSAVVRSTRRMGSGRHQLVRPGHLARVRRGPAARRRVESRSVCSRGSPPPTSRPARHPPRPGRADRTPGRPASGQAQATDRMHIGPTTDCVSGSWLAAR